MKNSSITIVEKTARRLEAVVGRHPLTPAELLRLAPDQIVCFAPVTPAGEESGAAGTDPVETDHGEASDGESGMAVEIRDGEDDRLIALGTLVRTADGFAVRVVRLVSILLVMMTLMTAWSNGVSAQIPHTAAPVSSPAPGSPASSGASGTPLPGGSASETPAAQVPGSIDSLLRTMAILGVMIVILVLVNRWLRRKFPSAIVPRLPDGVFEILGRAPFTARQNVLLVRFGDRLVLIALTPDGPVPLSEIDDPRQVGALMAKLGRAERRGPENRETTP